MNYSVISVVCLLRFRVKEKLWATLSVPIKSSVEAHGGKNICISRNTLYVKTQSPPFIFCFPCEWVKIVVSIIDPRSNNWLEKLHDMIWERKIFIFSCTFEVGFDIVYIMPILSPLRGVLWVLVEPQEPLIKEIATANEWDPCIIWWAVAQEHMSDSGFQAEMLCRAQWRIVWRNKIIWVVLGSRSKKLQSDSFSVFICNDDVPIRWCNA